MISRPGAAPNRPDAPLPPWQTSYYLESRESPEGSVAITTREPTNGSKPITTFRTVKGDREGPSSRIVYRPIDLETTQSFVRGSPVTFIDCTATVKGTAARITRCSNDTANPRSVNYFETSVPRNGGCPTAMGFLQPVENSIRHDVLETRVDECGPSTCIVTSAQDCDKYYHCTESKASYEGPSATMHQEPYTNLSGPEDPPRRI